MDVTVKTEQFEGPFDLLFHLIEKNEIDIYDIPIALLTDQYLEQLELMPERDMDSMSEFLVMASTLLEIKSRMLLPRPKNDEDEEEVDPREELVQRLIEYKRFKEIAERLSEKEPMAALVYYKPQDVSIPQAVRTAPPLQPQEALANISLELLYRAYEEAVKRRELKTDRVRAGFNAVVRDTYTIEGKSEYLKDLLKIYGQVNLAEVFAEASSKLECVVTFLAALELIKGNEIVIYQEKSFGDILITGRVQE